MSHNPSAFYGGFYDADRDVLVTDWIRWKMAFNKVYYTYEEEAEKFMIFTENREKVHFRYFRLEIQKTKVFSKRH